MFLRWKTELKRLINDYNKHTGRYMFLYAADLNKARKGVDVSLIQDAIFTIFQDILRESSQQIIDFYIETPGGSGEAAEGMISRFIGENLRKLTFVIAGEAKSAGTILVLSGDNIFMTETGV